MNWFSWEYDDGSQSSPDFNIEFDHSSNPGYQAKSYTLNRNRTNSRDCSTIQRRHHFSNVGSNNIDLYHVDN